MDVRAACRISPDRAEFRGFRAQLLSSLGRHREAAQEFSELTRLPSSPESAVLQTARACEACGEFEQALAHLEPLLENAQDISGTIEDVNVILGS